MAYDEAISALREAHSTFEAAVKVFDDAISDESYFLKNASRSVRATVASIPRVIASAVVAESRSAQSVADAKPVPVVATPVTPAVPSAPTVPPVVPVSPPVPPTVPKPIDTPGGTN